MKSIVVPALALIFAGAAAQAKDLSADELARRSVERRAVEAVIWGMPAVNYDLMLRAVMSDKGKANQVVYGRACSDSKNQTLTPNPDVIYLMPLFDTKESDRW